MSAALLERLRRETRPAHDRIESDLDLLGSLTSDRYRSLLQRWYGFHRVWEPAVRVAVDDPALMKRRSRLALLVHDLSWLGMTDEEIEGLPDCPDLPALNARVQALGSLYVVEGATLGGRLAAAHVARAIGSDGRAGCSYLLSYGQDVPAMWRTLRDRLAAIDGPGEEDLAVASAQATFARLQGWLVHGV